MNIHISRSEQKRRIKQLEQLVEETSRLPLSMIDNLPCSDEISDLFREVATLKGGARKRQVKYITKLLKNEQEQIDSLYSFVSKKQGSALKKKKEFHEIEYIRDSLLNEVIEQRRIARQNHEELDEDWSSEVVAEVGRRFPGVDEKALKRLALLFASTRSPKHSREIFRLLRASQEQEQFLREKQER